ncbi:MAG TPA: PLP-dependent transferase [Candidatus Dormibacteraeota bacterium]|nr:PLP-dependent transferase [Candidatus Dormibacteraeota bacterium]
MSTQPPDPAVQRRRPATDAVHGGALADGGLGAAMPPIILSSTFVHGSPAGYEYGRTDSPTWHPLEGALTTLEGGAGCVVFASGMAAITSVVEQVPVGARVVGSDASYSGVRRLLRDLDATGRISSSFVDVTDTDAVAAAAEGASLVCLEVVANPLLGVCDVPACAAAAHDAGAVVMVDSTFATPILLRPLEHGADVVVHSLSKYVGGHSDIVLGAAVAAGADVRERLASWRTMVGAIAGPFEAWLALRGLRTLEVRMRRQCASALDLAGRLAQDPRVAAVTYPGLASHPQHDRAARLLEGGFGAVLGVDAGSAEAAEAVCAATRVWRHATSLGGVESSLERRARYAMDAEICRPGYLRLSVGIEAVEDLWDDLDAALAAASG